jgi:GMP reductase
MLAQKLNFSDVLLVPRKSSNLRSRSEVTLRRKFNFKNSNRQWSGVPIVSSNMDTTGTAKMYRPLHSKEMITCFNKHIERYPMKLDPNGFMYSSGTNVKKLQKDIQKLRPKFVCFDVANGYMTKFHSILRWFRAQYPDITICAGNIVTPEMTEFYIKECGVDIVKIGIGSGSVCTTRTKTGIGYPQLSCVMECAKVAHKNGGYIMSDGGIKTPGDVSKAFAAGSDFVMLGSMLAGHDESGGDISYGPTGQKFVSFYGMSSQKANNKYAGGTKGYRSAEGREIKLEYKGPVEETLNDILGGVRSTCTYLNCEKLEQIPENAEFIKGV